jgi:flagellar basal-body rod protein FlgB
MENNLIHNAIIAKTGIPTVKRTLDLASLRQKITAGNISNAQTPNYWRRTIDFDRELKRLVHPDKLAGTRTHASHIAIGDRRDQAFEVKTDRKSPVQSINNVDVESEMVALAETQIWYQMGTTLARKKFSALRLAIRGER